MEKVAGSGRKKQNHTVLRLKAQERELRGLQWLERNCDPLKIMVDVILHPKCSLELKSKTAAELAKYLYVQRKAVEVAGPDGQPLGHKLEIIVRRVDQIPREELNPSNQIINISNQDNNIVNQDSHQDTIQDNIKTPIKTLKKEK